MYYHFMMNINKQKLKCIVLLLICVFIVKVQSQFFLSTLRINSVSQSFTVPYGKTLKGTQISFAYFIEYGTISQNTLKLTHSPTESTIKNHQFTIKFILVNFSNMIANDYLQVKVLISSYSPSLITMKMLQTPPSQSVSLQLPCQYNPSSLIKSLQAKVFPTVLPMTQTVTLNQTHLTILPTLTPFVITSVSFSVIIITRDYELSHIGLLIDNLQLGNLGWIILFNNDIFFDPNQGNMLIGITEYNITGVPVLDMHNQVQYEFSFPLYPDQRSVFIFYDMSNTTPTVFTTTIFIFTETFSGCPDGGFLTYTELYYDSPLSCQACHLTCQTCASTNYSLSITDETSCKSCSVFKYFEQVDAEYKTGRCHCYPGLSVNPVNQQCIPCRQQCLGFKVSFMRSSTQSLFLLYFSSLTRHLIPMVENLRIYVNNNFTANISYTLKQMKRNFYSIVVDSKGLGPCESKCEVNFTFIKPWMVLKQNKYESLTENTQSLYIENYYNVGDKIPDEINQAFAISSMLVGAAAGGGLSSLLKMLFQLQQMIQFHKYLNMQLPLIFKQFIESLSIFKFLDVTTLLPLDIDELLQSLSTDEFDTKGPIKSVYYENGANFYKNIIPILLSFGIVIGVNFVLFCVIRMLPFNLFWRLSQKLRVRAIITFSDLLETLILPTIVFANFQIFLTHYKLDIIYIYVLMGTMVFLILSLPFMIATYVFINRHRHQTKSVYLDLMQDCDLNRNSTYLFYLMVFYRKVIFGMILLEMIPGEVQGYAVLSINILYLLMILYIVVNRTFYSKFKILTKTLNLICVIAIQAIMIYYNKQAHPIHTMLDLGASCVYLAIIATVTGIGEALIKLFEIVFQNVKDSKVGDKIKTIQQNKFTKTKSIESIEKQFRTPIYCGLNDQSIQKITSAYSKDSLQTIDLDMKDKKSLWSRPRRKLNFLTNLMKRQNKSKQIYKKQRNEQKKNINEDSFSKLNNEAQNSVDFMTIDSNDSLNFGSRVKNENNIKNKRYHKQTIQKRSIQNNNINKSSQQNPKSPLKRPNTINQNSINSYENSNQKLTKEQDYIEFLIQKRAQRRVGQKKSAQLISKKPSINNQ